MASPSSLLSWPHRAISLSFQPKNPSSSPATARVSVQDPPPQDPPPPSDANPSLRRSSNTRYLWVNPNSPRAADLARARAGSSRRARLAATAAALGACEPPQEAPIAAALEAAFPEPPSEQDAVIVLNTTAAQPAAVVLALRWFLRNAEVRKKVILYNVVLKGMRKRRRWGDAEALWEEMLREGVQPDNATFSTVIGCARACGLPGKAVEWFERMPDFGCSPDMLTYSVVIDAYGRAGDAEAALRLYDRARAEKWQLDPVICATVIRVHSNSGNFDGALNVFEEMKAAGVKPNMVVYNTVLDAMGRAMRPWVVKTIHREMVSQEVLPSKATYSCLLQAYARARYGEDAMAVYRTMKDEVADIDVVLYNMLLSMCADIGYVEEAEEIFRDMKASMDARSKPDSWSYSSMVTLYSCTGDVVGAEGILNEMVEAGFKPNIFILTSLIRCYGKAGRTDDVVRSFAMLGDLGITPDDRFCGCLLTVAAGTPVEELDKVIGCIDRSNAQLGAVVRLLADRAAPSGEPLRDAAGELLGGARGVVKMPYCNCLMDLAVNLGQMEKACALLDVALRLGIYANVQTRTQTQWSLHLRGLSVGAALTTLHVWMGDLHAALQGGEGLPPLLGIHTGQGKNTYSDRGLAAVFEAHLKELDAPFHEAPDKAGWFLTTSVAAKHWLETKKSAELVAA
ncbi:pentatricopeptide repeat-containing protein ATP4 homolog, chloroplastic [Oryza brachyantha]|uniref:pentatricopeptide repeat-containing protein ATP4 homolog, chloroplastic n=1 Tax=Oryza brachyantha TaxID=4533 RepID=UPI001ADB12BE|nr:pentatricopeptide repeat-containing protein ATP4 homolog, chloroplastic [Oryza brachyantha]